ncbi:polysaccharide deacetylase family protein [Sulfurovum sp. bin170]|nr:polysaccharide deacetylase family protein [Sulfurovum sp. bin170]
MGFAKLFSFIFQRDKVTIILFHDMDRDSAEQAFSYLSDRYNIIDLDSYIEAHYRKDYSTIPKNALIVTFDDGHIGNHKILPIVKKYNIPITIFLCASIIDTNRHFWFQYDNESLDKSKLKNETERRRLEILKESGFSVDIEFDYPQALSRTQIDEMSPYVNMQSHTLFHPILPKCSDSDAKKEIAKSKEILEHKYGFDINTIAYPNGDYSDRDIEIAKRAGYKCGITVDYGFNSLESDIFRLKRVSINDTEDINELIVKSSGLWAFLKSRNGKKQSYGYSESVKEY